MGLSQGPCTGKIPLPALATKHALEMIIKIITGAIRQHKKRKKFKEIIWKILEAHALEIFQPY